MKSGSEDSDDGGCQVLLNVYDLTPINNYMYWFGLGIFHSGIEVHGMEYGFGAHDFPSSGVFEVEPRSCPGYIYRCSISLGRTNVPPLEFRPFIENMAAEYHGDTYHLITKNCNPFYRRHLLETNRQTHPWMGESPCPHSCLLPESLQVTAVKQLPEYHACSEEDGSESLSTTTPHEPAESGDADQDKHLLSPSAGGGDVIFIKDVQK